AGVAEVAPAVVVRAMAADVDHRVQAARPAEHLAARPEHAPPAYLVLRLGLERPVVLAAPEHVVEAAPADEERPLAHAGLEEEHARGGIFAQACRQDAAGRPGADDDVVVHPRDINATRVALRPATPARRGRRAVRGGRLAASSPKVSWRSAELD